MSSFGNLASEIYQDFAEKVFNDTNGTLQKGESVGIDIEESEMEPFISKKFLQNGYLVEKEENSLVVTKQ